jgi:hypothetical protein
LQDAGVEAILARLREEVHARPPSGATADDGRAAVPVHLTARREADRLAAVSADRPYYFRPGGLGRVRGLLLLPLKAVLKRLMRWYVEPVAHDQRQFNRATISMFDELAAQTGSLLEENRELRERVDRLSADLADRGGQAELRP